jgi:hypothetical protein
VHSNTPAQPRRSESAGSRARDSCPSSRLLHNPRRGRWIVSEGGFRNRPPHPSREVCPSRARHTQPLWQSSPRSRSGFAETALCNSQRPQQEPTESRRECRVHAEGALRLDTVRVLQARGRSTPPAVLRSRLNAMASSSAQRPRSGFRSWCTSRYSALEPSLKTSWIAPGVHTASRGHGIDDRHAPELNYWVLCGSRHWSPQAHGAPRPFAPRRGGRHRPARGVPSQRLLSK